MNLPAFSRFIPFCLTIILLLSASRSSFGQDVSHPVLGVRDTLAADDSLIKIYEDVEIEASFPGGLAGWQEYLGKNLNGNTPVVNGAPAGRYTVMVQFVVARDGKVSNVKALTKHGYGMEPEVMRIIRQSPPWLPAIQNGRTVRAYRKQPVTFEVIEEKRKRKKG